MQARGHSSVFFPVNMMLKRVTLCLSLVIVTICGSGGFISVVRGACHGLPLSPRLRPLPLRGFEADLVLFWGGAAKMPRCHLPTLETQEVEADITLSLSPSPPAPPHSS